MIMQPDAPPLPLLAQIKLMEKQNLSHKCSNSLLFEMKVKLNDKLSLTWKATLTWHLQVTKLETNLLKPCLKCQ